MLQIPRTTVLTVLYKLKWYNNHRSLRVTFSHQEFHKRAGERALTDLQRPGSTPSTHVRRLTAVYGSRSRGSKASGLLTYLHSLENTHIYT